MLRIVGEEALWERRFGLRAALSHAQRQVDWGRFPAHRLGPAA